MVLKRLLNATPCNVACVETNLTELGAFMVHRFFKRIAGDRKGVTALEYGLIAAVMGALIVIAFTTLGGDLGTAFSDIGGLLTTTASGM